MKTALITGGGSGIGLELVRLFAKDDYKIVVFSLDQNELDELKQELTAKLSHENIHLVQADLSLPNAAMQVLNYCDEKKLEIDVLVNNAGFALWGEVAEQNITIGNKLLQLNIVALTELSQVFGERMKSRGAGKILNIGSTMGISPVPLAALYASSKAYVNAFSVALAFELEPHGVEVSCIEPYLTKTKFMTTSMEHSTKTSGPDYSVEEIEKAANAHSATMVAEKAYAGLMKGEKVIMPGKIFHLIAWLMRTLPQIWVAKFFYKQSSKNL